MSDAEEPTEEAPQQDTPPQPIPGVLDDPQGDLVALLGVESFEGETFTRGATPTGEQRVLELQQKQSSPPPEQPESDE
jgi:hypothetical protein